MNEQKAVPIISILALIVPLLVALIFHPIWRISTKGTGNEGTIVALITMALNFAITPIYLVIMTGIAKNYLGFVVCIIISVISLYGSLCLQFWNWGTANGMLNKSDSSSLMIFQIEAVVSTIILAVGMLILFIIKSRQA